MGYKFPDGPLVSENQFNQPRVQNVPSRWCVLQAIFLEVNFPVCISVCCVVSCV